ncbi:MAG TPA: radical SAM protein [Candidatus Nanoarchaeia archaeon]|nr:radical SAM protein [Candidatus Nanoarchaeia archaeon]
MLLRTITSLIKKRPILAVWNVTDMCNYKCRFCSSHGGTTQLSLGETEKAVQTVAQLGVSYVYVAGGEPLVRKDIIQILEMFLKYGIKPTLITNGSLLNQEIINYVKDKPINLSVSIQTLNPELNYQITLNKSLPQILEFFKSLGNVQHKGNWSISTTVNQMNYNEVDELEKFATAHNFMYIIRPYISGIGPHGRYDPGLVYKEPDKIIALFQKFSARERRRNFLLHLVYEQQIKYLKGEDIGPCDAGRHSLLVTFDGSVSPCLEKPGLCIKGDAATTKEFLSSEKVTSEVKRCHSETPCYYGCGRNVGTLLRHKGAILAHMPLIAYHAARYGLFF